MKTGSFCPNAQRNEDAESLAAQNQVLKHKVPDGLTLAALQEGTSPLRVVRKCLKTQCIRWQENRCGAARKMMDTVVEKNQPLPG
ncbi:MAG: hypothetical protein INR73_22935 [Williamsia sp.]|nr:hypothetical protein [Williamsia sp.]